jgi:uncharacterized protein YgiB involved in biofilm formation
VTQIRKMKRSHAAALTTLTAASTLALQGCGEDSFGAEGQVFSTVAECVSSGVAQADCQEAYAAAQADDANDAPRFENRELCEGEFGQNECQARSDGGGSFWVPLLAGFVIANAIDGDLDFDRRKRRYAPLYRNRGSGTWYHGGSNYGAMSRASSGRYGFDQAALNRPVSAPRVQSRSDIASRGGFGGRARSSGSSSSGG